MPQRPLWGLRISAHLWTKSAAAGVFLIWALLSFAGGALPKSADLRIALVCGLCLMMSGALLAADLGRPRMFLDVLLKPHWRSWATRGAYLLTCFGIVVALFVAAAWFGFDAMARVLRLLGTLLAVLVATYTAFLLGQFRRFELWQSPLLPAHLLVQAALAGSAILTILGPISGASGSVRSHLVWALIVTLGAHLSLMVGESVVSRGKNRSADKLTRGPFALPYWAAMLIGVVFALIAALFGERFELASLTSTAGVLALAGLFCWEHAFIGAGQVFVSRGQMEFSLPAAALIPRAMVTVYPLDAPDGEAPVSAHGRAGWHV